jgi:hypothetical protein
LYKERVDPSVGSETDRVGKGLELVVEHKGVECKVALSSMGMEEPQGGFELGGVEVLSACACIPVMQPEVDRVGTRAKGSKKAIVVSSRCKDFHHATPRTCFDAISPTQGLVVTPNPPSPAT